MKPNNNVKKIMVNVAYFDESAVLENRLRAIAELCQGCGSEGATPEVLEEIGIIIKSYVETKRILDHYFLERFINEDEFDDVFLKAELYKLDERYPITSDSSKVSLADP